MALFWVLSLVLSYLAGSGRGQSDILKQPLKDPTLLSLEGDLPSPAKNYVSEFGHISSEGWELCEWTWKQFFPADSWYDTAVLAAIFIEALWELLRFKHSAKHFPGDSDRKESA